MASEAEPTKRGSQIVRRPCSYRVIGGLQCSCTGEKCPMANVLSDQSLAQTRCERCDHYMGAHEPYKDTTSTAPDADIPGPRREPYPIASIVSCDKLVHGLISLVETYRLVLVRGTPACGKTTFCDLAINALLQTHLQTAVYVLNGWNKDRVLADNGWENHLKKRTGVHGSQ